jgi:NADH-quinone oxidoreductase subunit J
VLRAKACFGWSDWSQSEFAIPTGAQRSRGICIFGPQHYEYKPVFSRSAFAVRAVHLQSTFSQTQLPQAIHDPVERFHSMYLALFFIFGFLCVGGALNLLLQRHPINSALSLIVVMTSLAVLYLLLGAEFLAAAQVIVYSGAIMVLFTFVIMLLNAGEEERTRGSKAAYLVGFPGAAAIFGLLTFIFLSAKTQLGTSKLGDYIVSTSDLSKVLFRNLLLPFEVTSVLILVAILGAVALARKEH